MKTVWKVLIGLALVVPMGAYVAGSLAASAADDPAPRETIEIREPDPDPRRRPRPPTPTADPDAAAAAADDRRRRGDHARLRRLRRPRRPRGRRRRRPPAVAARRRRHDDRSDDNSGPGARGLAVSSASGSPRPSRCSCSPASSSPASSSTTIESRRLDQQITAEVDQEFAEFTELQKDGVNPATSQPFASPEAMVRLFLRSNVPDDNELLVGWWDDGVGAQSPEWDEISRSAWFPDAVRPLLADNGTTTVDSEYGELQVTAQSVGQGGRPARWSSSRSSTGPATGLHETMRTYAIVAALALLLVTAMACVGVRPAALAAAHAARDRRRDLRDRPVPAAPGHRQRRHHRAHPDLQRDARPAGVGVRRPARVPRRRRPRAEDPADRAARPPRAARHRQPRGRRRDPAAAARRDRPDVPAGRRPDPAREERPARLPRSSSRSTSAASPPTWSRRRAASATATGSSTAPPTSRCVADEQRLTQAVLQLADNAVKHTRDGDTVGDRLVVRPRPRPGSGSATPGPGCRPRIVS